MYRDRNWFRFCGLAVVAVFLLVSSFTGTFSPLQAASLCDHPYFPVAPTIQRMYQTTYGIGLPPLRYVERITGVTDTGFAQELETERGNFTRVWTCTADGLINSDPGNLSIELRMKNEESSGVTLLPAARLKPGAAWQRHYQLRGTMPILEGSEVWGTLDIHFQVIGPGPITVPAGSYETIRISFTQVQRFTMKHKGDEAPIHSVLKGTLWYAKDVGLVKTEVETAAVTELLTFKK